MHATYLFLVSEADVDKESRWEEWGSQVDAYVERYGDGNNWYTILLGVRHSGEVHTYSEKSAHFESDAKTTFEDAMRLSVGCVASDVRLSGSPGISLPGMEESDAVKRLNEMTYEELRQEIIAQAFAALGWEFSKMSAQSWEAIAAREDFARGATEELGMYQLKKMTYAMLCFLDSAVPPFTHRQCTPYDYRCFDLRSEDSDSTDLTNCAIIYVDIHT